MLKRMSAAVLFLAVATVAFGQPKPAAKQSEFQKLQTEYSAKVQEYYKPYQSAKSQEDMAKIKLDPKKNPVPTYLPKFKKLAEKSGKTVDGFRAWVMVKQLAEQSGDNKAADAASQVLMTRFVDSPWIGQFASSLPYSSWNLPQPEREKKIGGMLSKIERAAKTDEVRATAMYARAQLIGRDGQGDVEAAAKIYRDVVAKYPNTEQGKRAKNDIFEMENLIVGKMAPDFEATDQDGAKFKLSDYRGKVVVLDFWGFW